MEQQGQQQITPKTSEFDFPSIPGDPLLPYDRARIEAYNEEWEKSDETEPASSMDALRDVPANGRKGWPKGKPRGPRPPRIPKPAPLEPKEPEVVVELDEILSKEYEDAPIPEIPDPMQPKPEHFLPGSRAVGATYSNPAFVDAKAKGYDREYVKKYTRARLPSILKEMFEMIKNKETPKNTKARLMEVWLEYSVDKPRMADADDEGQQPLAIGDLPDAS